MTVFRSLFLAGLALFFAAQQALCACAVPQAAGHPGMATMTHDVPAGHACDEAMAPDHDTSDCPHCSTDTQLVLQAAQSVPAPVILAAPVPPPIHLADMAAPAPLQRAAIRPALYQAHGPPRTTPLQLKTRFLN